MKKISIEEHIAISLAILLFLALIIGTSLLTLRLSDSKTVTAECEVSNKFCRTVNNTKAAYYLDILFVSEGLSLEKTILFSKASLYNEVQIGDKILCEVTYDEDGIIDIEVTDPALEHYSSAQDRNFTMIMMAAASVVLAGAAIVVHIQEAKKKPIIENDMEKG